LAFLPNRATSGHEVTALLCIKRLVTPNRELHFLTQYNSRVEVAVSEAEGTPRQRMPKFEVMILA
jgi:hypothetical protein